MFGLDLLDARVAFEIDAKVKKRMPGDGQSVIPESTLEIVLREKSPIIRLLDFVREYCYPATPADLANCVRRRESSRATAYDRHRPKRKRDLVPSDTTKCLRAGWLYGEAIILDRTGYSSEASKAGAAVAS